MRENKSEIHNALLNAVLMDNIQNVRRALIEGYDPDYINSDGWSSLKAAVLFDRNDMVELLIREGADCEDIEFPADFDLASAQKIRNIINDNDEDFDQYFDDLGIDIDIDEELDISPLIRDNPESINFIINAFNNNLISLEMQGLFRRTIIEELGEDGNNVDQFSDIEDLLDAVRNVEPNFPEIPDDKFAPIEAKSCFPRQEDKYNAY